MAPSTFWSSTSKSTLTFPHTKYSNTDKYVLKYKYQVQVLYLTPTLVYSDYLVCSGTAIAHIYVIEYL